MDTTVYTEIPDILLAYKIHALDLATTDTKLPYAIWHSGPSNDAEFVHIASSKADSESVPRIKAAETTRNSMLAATAPAPREYVVIPYYNPEPSKLTLAGLPAEIKKKIYELCLYPRTIIARVVMVKRLSLSRISESSSTSTFEFENVVKFEFYGAPRPNLAKVSKYEEFFLKEMVYKPLFKSPGSNKVHYFHPGYDKVEFDLSLCAARHIVRLNCQNI
ncbi:hypothetical protein F5884DRAFT_855365 [Xylogone sp. PMI_703]|nr:hypothetical protein F5884DRAFT_855365 [Xylogone sp. PMI_703]